MKRTVIFIGFIILLIQTNIFAQNIDNNYNLRLKARYERGVSKHTRFARTGEIILGAGLTALLGGGYLYSSTIRNHKYKPATTNTSNNYPSYQYAGYSDEEIERLENGQTIAILAVPICITGFVFTIIGESCKLKYEKRLENLNFDMKTSSNGTYFNLKYQF